jgi:shikimate dehydrogenase
LKYEIFDLDEYEIDEFIKSLYKNDIIGFNVTIPYKQIITRYIDKYIFPADKINAVNTVVVSKNSVKGFNTDYFGFLKSLEDNKINLKGKKALILGAGGSARSVYLALSYQQCSYVDIGVRNPERVNADYFNASKIFLLQNENDYSEYDIVINCTPLGGVNFIESCPIDVSTLKKGCIIYDLVYKPEKTKLMKEAEKIGCNIINGESMLINQAHASADIWVEELKKINGGF